MLNKCKKLLTMLFCSMLVVTLLSMPTFAQEENDSKKEITQENVLTGNQKVFIKGLDAGPAVTKTIIKLNDVVKADSVDKNDFVVEEEKNATVNGNNDEIEIVKTNRTIEDIYVSNENGNRVNTDSNYITIEMYGSPKEGSPFIYTGLNNWCNPYNLNITLVGEINTENGVVDSVVIDPSIDLAGDGKICPQIENFNFNKYSATDGQTYSYADYVPATDNKKNPLIIWLHGGGEGGSDPQITLLANKASNYASKDFQEEMGGAYVLVPQCPTKWMYDETGNYQYGDKGSFYADGLFELIQKYVNENSDIDKNRIIIGGCSNGGYMTIELLLKHPTYFSAAFPICEAFWDKYISDEQINSIKDIPMWFTYAKTDNNTVAVKEECSIPTIERLKKAGAKDLHVSVIEKVLDENKEFNKDGLPYQNGDEMYEYDGHWSWIYVHNNWLKDGEMSIWSWLSKQAKTSDIQDVIDTNNPTNNQDALSPSTSVKTGDNNYTLLILGIVISTAGLIYSIKTQKKYI